MNILITGGAGFIGSNLALKLVAEGNTVTVLDNLSPQIHGANAEEESVLFNTIKNKVTFIHGCVTNRQSWLTAIANNEVIVHLAAETGTGQSMYLIKKYTDINIAGTALMLDILANEKHGVKKVVIASSRAIYGEGQYLSKTMGNVYPLARSSKNLLAGNFEVTYQNLNETLQLVPTTEDAKIHPSSVYGITKQNQEQMVMTVCPTIGIAGVALRYQNVYGPGQSLSNPYTGILSIFSTQIKNNLPINIFEDGEESRDFVFISDVVEATYLAIIKHEANNQIFNVGSGVATTVNTVANTLVNHYKINVPITITGNFRLGDIRHNFADINKIKLALNFIPTVNFNDGTKQFCNWVNGQKIEVSKYEWSLQELKAKGLMQ